MFFASSCPNIALGKGALKKVSSLRPPSPTNTRGTWMTVPGIGFGGAIVLPRMFSRYKDEFSYYCVDHNYQYRQPKTFIRYQLCQEELWINIFL